jgi:hypothetical protein
MSKKNIPKRVENVEEYWTKPPPERSPRCWYWLKQIENGWRPNKRVRSMGYHERADFYGVWIWESINVIDPKLEEVTRVEVPR